MKTRKIALVGLLSLLLAGGLLTAGVAQHRTGGARGGHHGKNHGGDAKNQDGKRGKISTRIYEITEADSIQKIKMKPFVDKASKRMESLRASYQKQEGKLLDSLRAQLKPILKGHITEK